MEIPDNDPVAVAAAVRNGDLDVLGSSAMLAARQRPTF
jgi:hypothetical protein